MDHPVKETVREFYEAALDFVQAGDHIKTAKREDITSNDRKRINKSIDRLIELAMEVKTLQEVYGRVEE